MKTSFPLLALALLNLVASNSGAQTVSLNAVVSTGDTIGGYPIGNFAAGNLTIGYRPGLNDAGTVSFLANTPGSQRGWFSQSASLAHYSDVIDGTTLVQALGALGSINSSGLATFDWSYNDDSLDFRGAYTQNHVLAKSGDTIGGSTINFVHGSADINDSGTSAFYAFLNTGAGIFTQTSRIAKAGDVIAGKTIADVGYNPSINNSGTVAFTGYSPAGGYGTALFTQSQCLVAAGDVVSSATIYSVGDPVINNNNQVISYVQLDTGLTHRDAILTVGSGLSVKSGDVVAGKTLTGLQKYPTVNDAGLVAYTGTFSGGSGIFAGNLLVAQTGDTLGGRIFSAFSDPAVNDLNQLAFYANFTDGSQAIVIATLTPVPEPSSFMLAAIGFVLVALGMRRRMART